MIKIGVVNLSDNLIEDSSQYISKLKELWPNSQMMNYTCPKEDYEMKISRLIQAYNDDTVDLIICLNGGTTTINLIKEERISRLIKNTLDSSNKKLIVGYSDIDHINLYLLSKGYRAVSGFCVKELCDYHSSKDLKQLISIVENKSYTLPIKEALNFKSVGGKVLASNIQILSIMLSKLNKSMFKDKLLFLEDHTNDDKMVIYYIDFLKSEGVLENIKGIIFGEARKCQNKPKIIEYLSKNVSVPVIDIDFWSYVPNDWYCEVKKDKLVLKPRNDSN